MDLRSHKICRRSGVKLCDNFKCPVQKKPYPPGIHGKNRRRRSQLSEYGNQLLTKQKTKRIYGVQEKQFRKYFTSSASIEAAIQKLELRFDNVVFRLGLAPTRPMARQLVNHGHFMVNDKRVTIPSYSVKPQDSITIRDRSKKSPVFQDLPTTLKKYEPPSWLSIDVKNLEGKVTAIPTLQDAGLSPEVTLIGEFYSR